MLHGARAASFCVSLALVGLSVEREREAHKERRGNIQRWESDCPVCRRLLTRVYSGSTYPSTASKIRLTFMFQYLFAICTFYETWRTLLLFYYILSHAQGWWNIGQWQIMHKSVYIIILKMFHLIFEYSSDVVFDCYRGTFLFSLFISLILTSFFITHDKV